MRMCNLSKALSITALENVSIGKLLLRFSAQKVLHLLDFLPCHGTAVTEGLYRNGFLFALAYNRNKHALHNPSVKNQRFLPAPFAQGRADYNNKCNTKK